MGVGADPLVDPAPAGDPGPVLEPMCLEDLDEVMEIERRSFDQPWTRGMFVHELRIPFAASIVARQPSTRALLGYACWWVLGDELQLLNLAVREAGRRQGIGGRLFGRIVAAAAAAGVRVITLEVSERNAAALAFYRCAGFGERGRRRNYYGAGNDAVLMDRTVPSAQDDATAR